jgi:hypothetical protein
MQVLNMVLIGAISFLIGIALAVATLRLSFKKKARVVSYVLRNVSSRGRLLPCEFYLLSKTFKNKGVFGVTFP